MMQNDNMFENYSDIVTVKELREMLKTGRNTAYNLIHTDQLEIIRIRKNIRITKSSIIRFCTNRNL